MDHFNDYLFVGEALQRLGKVYRFELDLRICSLMLLHNEQAVEQGVRADEVRAVQFDERGPRCSTPAFDGRSATMTAAAKLQQSLIPGQLAFG